MTHKHSRALALAVLLLATFAGCATAPADALRQSLSAVRIAQTAALRQLADYSVQHQHAIADPVAAKAATLEAAGRPTEAEALRADARIEIAAFRERRAVAERALADVNAALGVLDAAVPLVELGQGDRRGVTVTLAAAFAALGKAQAAIADLFTQGGP